jgi:hypothetical protein
MPAPFDTHREQVDVEIYVAGRAIGKSNVIYSETSFQSTASAQPGMCSIAVRGEHDFVEGSLAALVINGERRWQGFITIIEKGFVFEDEATPKTTLRGVDLNILFDKLILYNHDNPALGLTGGGTWPIHPTTGVITIPANLPDAEYITALLKDTDLDLISPTIRTQLTEVGPINPGDERTRPINPGGTLRAMFNDVAGVVNRLTPGSVIFYIDTDGYIVYQAQDTMSAPFSVGDGGIECRDLLITTDITKIKNDVLIFAGSLNPDPAVTPRPFLLFRHNSRTASIAQYGRFQYSEVVPSWSQAMINARSTKILFQEGDPAMRASFTIFRSGLVPGMIVNVSSAAHGFLDNLPVRSVSIRFPTPTIARYDVVASFDTGDPWGLLLALKRPPLRGLVQPVFQSIDLLNQPKPPTVEPYTYVSEEPAALGGNRYQTSYAYIRYGISVWDDGRRQISSSDLSGSAVFVETDPDRGLFTLANAPTGRVYCAYHVLSNLATEAVA